MPSFSTMLCTNDDLPEDERALIEVPVLDRST